MIATKTLARREEGRPRRIKKLAFNNISAKEGEEPERRREDA